MASGVTGSNVVFDSRAWWEVMFAISKGKALSKRYLKSTNFRVHTSALACGELTARMLSAGSQDRVPVAMASVRRSSLLIDVTPEVTEEGGRLRAELRKRDPDASLADGIMLATARSLGAKLVSADPAFEGQPDVTDR